MEKIEQERDVLLPVGWKEDRGEKREREQRRGK